MNLVQKLNNYFFEIYYRKKIVRENIKHFKNLEKTNKSQILLEFNAFHNFHISSSYLVNFLKKKFGYKIIGFFNYTILSSNLEQNLYEKIKWFLLKKTNYKNFGLYKSFGVQKFIKPILNFKQKKKQNKRFIEIKKKIKNKKQLLNLKIDKIYIGDLIYDTYLKKFYEPTILFDKKFYKLLYDFIGLYIFWIEYFKQNPVKVVITGHFVYSYGLIVRIALNKDIECFNITTNKIFKASLKHPVFDGKALELKKIINSLNQKTIKEGILVSKKILKKRIYSKKLVGGDLPYVSKSSFKSNNFKNKILKVSDKKKVLICSHDFFDAAHFYRNNIFIDYSEWLNFLGKLSEKTNFDWYIKTHPYYDDKFKSFQSISYNEMKKIVDGYKKIKILPNDISHNQLVKEGIDLVLTVHGTVSMEYALMGKKVITACKNNPFCDFNFNIHAQNKKDYENKILNFDKIRLNIDKNEIYKFYFARHIFLDVNWLMQDYKKFIKTIGGFNNQFNYRMYKYWIPYLNKKNHIRINQTIERFYDSNENYLNINHSKNKIDINLK